MMVVSFDAVIASGTVGSFRQSLDLARVALSILVETAFSEDQCGVVLIFVSLKILHINRLLQKAILERVE